jgi:hypothetical protein
MPAPEPGSGPAEHPVEDLAGGEAGQAGVDQHQVPRLESVGDAEADAQVPQPLAGEDLDRSNIWKSPSVPTWRGRPETSVVAGLRVGIGVVGAGSLGPAALQPPRTAAMSSTTMHRRAIGQRPPGPLSRS